MRSNQEIKLVGPLEDPLHQRKKRTADKALCEESPLTPVEEVSVNQIFWTQFSHLSMTLPGTSTQAAQAVPVVPSVATAQEAVASALVSSASGPSHVC